MLSFASLSAVAGLAHGVTTRPGGVSRGRFEALNLGRSTGDDPEHVAENRRRVAERLGFDALVSPRQVHGARLVEVHDGQQDPGEADGLFTNRPGLLLGVLGADCPGVLLVDPVHRALAVVHAGWRGTVENVVGAAVRALVERYATRPDDLRVAIGPGISARRYEVGPDVAEPLARAHPDARRVALTRGRDDRWHADLTEVLALQLTQAGVPRGRIERSPLCTFEEHALLFSHRRDGAAAGRHALVAGWHST